MPPTEPTPDLGGVRLPPDVPVTTAGQSPRVKKHDREMSALNVDRLRLENAKLEAEVAALRLRNDVLTQEVSRLWWDKYTRLLACAAIFAIVVGWLAVVAVLLLNTGISRSDAVFVAALGTTSVNVLGLLYIVARYLFPIPTRGNADLPPSTSPAAA